MKIEKVRQEKEAQMEEECMFISSYSNLNPKALLDEVDRSLMASSSSTTNVNDNELELSDSPPLGPVPIRSHKQGNCTRKPQEPNQPPDRLRSSHEKYHEDRTNYHYNEELEEVAEFDRHVDDGLGFNNNYTNYNDTDCQPIYPPPPPAQDYDYNNEERSRSHDEGHGSQRHPAFHMHNSSHMYENEGDHNPPLPTEPPPQDHPDDTILSAYFSSSVVGSASRNVLSSSQHEDQESSEQDTFLERYNYSNRELEADVDDFESTSLLQQLAMTDFDDHGDNYSSAYELEDEAYHQQLKLQEQHQGRQVDQRRHPQAQSSPPISNNPRPDPVNKTELLKITAPSKQPSTRRRPPPTPVSVESRSRDKDRNNGVKESNHMGNNSRRGNYNFDIL